MFINTTNQYITQTDVWQGHVFLFIFRLVVNQFQAWFSIMIVWVMYSLKEAVVCMEKNLQYTFSPSSEKIKSYLIPPKTLPLNSSFKKWKKFIQKVKVPKSFSCKIWIWHFLFLHFQFLLGPQGLLGGL